MKNELTKTEKSQIAEILESLETTSSWEFIGLMIELNHMGVTSKGDNKYPEYKIYHDYVKPQIEASIYSKNHQKIPLFSQFLINKIEQFGSDVLKDWFYKYFVKVEKHIEENNFEWNCEYMCDFQEYVGFVTESFMEKKDINSGIYNFNCQEDEQN
jgi:hypothetical protein